MVSANVNIFSSFGRANKLKNELITSLNSKVKLVAKVGIQEQVRLGGHGYSAILSFRSLETSEEEGHFKTLSIRMLGHNHQVLVEGLRHINLPTQYRAKSNALNLFSAHQKPNDIYSVHTKPNIPTQCTPKTQHTYSVHNKIPIYLFSAHQNPNTSTQCNTWSLLTLWLQRRLAEF